MEGEGGGEQVKKNRVSIEAEVAAGAGVSLPGACPCCVVFFPSIF